MRSRIIDFHIHTFSDKIAPRAVDQLRRSANTLNYLDGTDTSLSVSTKENGIECSIVLPVATRPGQAHAINVASAQKNQRMEQTGLLFFAAIHPADENTTEMLSEIKAAGFLGIKLHPLFQDEYIDGIRYMRLIEKASELELVTVIHAGYDISFHHKDFANVAHILNMIKQVKPHNVVLAHMGGWGEWDAVESDLCGADVYFDTSFCMTPIIPFEPKGEHVCKTVLGREQFVRIVRKHGADKILFGSDSPWAKQSEAIEVVKKSGLEEAEVRQILGLNAQTIASFLNPSLGAFSRWSI